MQGKDDHHHSDSCQCGANAAAAQQSLDELEFERGIWQAALNNDRAALDSALRRNGNDANQRDSAGLTALHYAAQRGHAEFCDELLRRGADANARSNAGTLPLHRAAYGGHTSILRALLKAGARADERDGDGMAAAHKASSQGHVDALRVLLHAMTAVAATSAAAAAEAEEGHDARATAEACKDAKGRSVVDVFAQPSCWPSI